MESVAPPDLPIHYLCVHTEAYETLTKLQH